MKVCGITIAADSTPRRQHRVAGMSSRHHVVAGLVLLLFLFLHVSKALHGATFAVAPRGARARRTLSQVFNDPLGSAHISWYCITVPPLCRAVLLLQHDIMLCTQLCPLDRDRDRSGSRRAELLTVNSQHRNIDAVDDGAAGRSDRRWT